MTFHPLRCHAEHPAPPGLAIAAGAAFMADGSLHCRYRITGDLENLLLPPAQTPTAMDGLWQHSCCEAFVATVDAPDYHEFNFSPSGCWAAYRFSDYRRRDETWPAAATPQITLGREGDRLYLDAVVPAALLPTGSALRLGLTAVVESRGGDKSYWALQHAGPHPDFHLPASFTLALNRP